MLFLQTQGIFSLRLRMDVRVDTNFEHKGRAKTESEFLLRNLAVEGIVDGVAIAAESLNSSARCSKQLEGRRDPLAWWCLPRNENIFLWNRNALEVPKDVGM